MAIPPSMVPSRLSRLSVASVCAQAVPTSRRWRQVMLATGSLVYGACAPDARGAESDSIDSSSQGEPLDGGTGSGSNGGSASDGAASTDSGSNDGAIAQPCTQEANADQDRDGFLMGAGDCNDCDSNVNPGAFDVPGNAIDEDCTGTPDDEPAQCDDTLVADADSAFDAARALGLCRRQVGASWGLVRAAWVFPDGTARGLTEDGCRGGAPPFPLSHGILSSFGPNVDPREGGAMVAISSGVARAGVYTLPESAEPPSGESPNAASIGTCSRPPAGFPRGPELCGGGPRPAVSMVLDGMALELTIKVPSNAEAVSFDLDFYTTEFPRFVCSELNDGFVALLMSAHPQTPADHNISFDAQGNPISVNNAFLEVCKPITAFDRTFPCRLGPQQLEGTGFAQEMGWDDGTYLQGGATGWLTSRAPVIPGETITLRFAIWDTGDTVGDATTLIDNIKWLAAGGTIPAPAKPETVPVLL